MARSLVARRRASWARLPSSRQAIMHALPWPWRGPEQIAFHHPVSVGQLVELHAYVTRDGRSSMTVEVEMISENLSTGHRSQAVKGQFEMVSVDEHGKPKPYRPQT